MAHLYNVPLFLLKISRKMDPKPSRVENLIAVIRVMSCQKFILMIEPITIQEISTQDIIRGLYQSSKVCIIWPQKVKITAISV